MTPCERNNDLLAKGVVGRKNSGEQQGENEELGADRQSKAVGALRR